MKNSIISQYFNSGLESKVLMDQNGSYIVECYRHGVKVSSTPVSNQNLAQNLAEDFVGIGEDFGTTDGPQFLGESK